MKVLVIGNGGREDAICFKVAQSPQLTQLYCSNGNAGTLRYATNVSLDSHDEILKFAVENQIDLVIVGPEQPLCDGLVDLLTQHNIKAFGANKKSAQLEASKDFAKQFMNKYDLPTARYETVTNKESAIQAIQQFQYPLVIKADGLCAGKGVKICNTEQEALYYIEQLFDDHIFGDQGSKAVIEQFLVGQEASLLCIVSHNTIIPLASAKDYKRIFEHDTGENTGGVGCYSPSELFDENLSKKIESLLSKITEGFTKEQLHYNGILFIGLMIDQQHNPQILEFNVRFGDPETEVILPRLKSDLLTIMNKTLNHTIKKEDIIFDNCKAMTVVLTSQGYPGSYEKDKVITHIETIQEPVFVFHNNTYAHNEEVYSDGGRVLSVTVLGDDFKTMRQQVYSAIEKIEFSNKQFRNDIALHLE